MKSKATFRIISYSAVFGAILFNAIYNARKFLLDFHNHTVLFRAGRIIFVTYGVLAAIGFAVGAFIALLHYQNTGGDGAQFVQFSVFLLFPMVMLGARLFSILLEWRNLLTAPLATLIKPGYMLHGGVLGGALAIIVASNYWQMPAIRLIDAWSIGLPLGEAIARIGCFVYGCCWGKETDSRFAVCYTNPDAKVLRVNPHLTNRSIYPAQLIGMGLYFALFVFMLIVSQWSSAPGLLGAVYLTLHPILRIYHERFRKDERGEAFKGVSHTNVYSAIQFTAGLGLFAWVQIVGIGNETQIDGVVGATLSGGALVAFLGTISAGAAIVFGVHVDNVGQWLSTSHLHSHAHSPIHVHATAIGHQRESMRHEAEILSENQPENDSSANGSLAYALVQNQAAATAQPGFRGE